MDKRDRLPFAIIALVLAVVVIGLYVANPFNLGNLGDVEVGNITDGQTIVYDAASGTYVPGNGTGGGGGGNVTDAFSVVNPDQGTNPTASGMDTLNLTSPDLVYTGNAGTNTVTAIYGADSVQLGPDTSGNYLLTVLAGAGINIVGAPGEGWTATISATGGGGGNVSKLDDLSDVSGIVYTDGYVLIADGTEYVSGVMNGANVTVLGDPGTLDEFLTDVTQDGVLDAVTITDAGGLNVTWTAGQLFIQGNIVDIDSRVPNYALTDNSVNYFYGNETSGSTLIVATTFPSGHHALVARAYTYGGDIEYMLHEPIIAEAAEVTHESLDAVHSDLVVSGLVIAADPDGTNANDFLIPTGTYYLHAHDQITVSSTLYSAGIGHGANSTDMYFHVGGAWNSYTDNGVDFAQWDNGTDLVGTNAGKWYVAWIFLEGTGNIQYVYPQTEHATENSALLEPLTYPPQHQGYVIPLAKFVFRHGEVAFITDRAYLVDIRPLHGGSTSTGAVQNLWYTFTGDTGTTSTDDPLDSFAIDGAGTVSTAIAGDVVTITGNVTAADVAGTGAWMDTDLSGARAYLNGNYAHAAGTYIVPLNVETWDINGEFNIGNYTFMPNEAGYYQVNGAITFLSISDTYLLGVVIHKNGVIHSSVYNNSSKNGQIYLGVSVSDIVYLNGIGDYVQLYAHHNQGINLSLVGTSSYTYMSIWRVG